MPMPLLIAWIAVGIFSLLGFLRCMYCMMRVPKGKQSGHWANAAFMSYGLFAAMTLLIAIGFNIDQDIVVIGHAAAFTLFSIFMVVRTFLEILQMGKGSSDEEEQALKKKKERLWQCFLLLVSALLLLYRYAKKFL